MGIYLNPGNKNFRRITNADIYVDKTMMISSLNRYSDKGNTNVCVSRPRRFGKTFAGNMLTAYYSKGCDSSDLFSPFRIASEPDFKEKLNRYNVIKIDMNSEYQNTRNKEKLVERLTDKIKKEMQQVFSTVAFNEEDTLGESILNVYAATGETFIILIDEYDVLVREEAAAPLFEEYLSLLNGLKPYLTGSGRILPGQKMP